MDDFSEDYSTFLLSKEWLVKIDNHTSTPYLIKFFSSTVDITCCILVTDTKSVWVEVMSGNQFARRWGISNSVPPPPFSETKDDAWRATMLDLLSKAHTLGGIADLSFAVSESRYADRTFELECDTFKWRWETCFIGHKRSAEIISKHLIFPLISVNHLAFSSGHVLAELPDADVEKAVDKVGRTARRTVDTHIRNALSKPRVATTLRRMTSMFNFIPDLPAVVSTPEKPDFRIDGHALRAKTRSEAEIGLRDISPPDRDVYPDEKMNLEGRGGSSEPPLVHADSATESEGDGYILPDGDKLSAGPSTQQHSNTALGNLNCDAINNSRHSPLPSTSKPNSSKDLPSDSESSPARPSKKLKQRVTSSSDDDSEEERKRRVAQLKSGAVGGAGGAKRGTRQPIRRGGKRF